MKKIIVFHEFPYSQTIICLCCNLAMSLRLPNESSTAFACLHPDTLIEVVEVD